MDQATLISMSVFIFTNMGTIIAMFLWIRSEANADRREALDLIIGIKEEMKDFHNRLALQDQEFKMRLCAIEERNKGQK